MADGALELRLSSGPLHGAAMAGALRERSGRELKVEEGALYPALHRLEKRGLLEAGTPASQPWSDA